MTGAGGRLAAFHVRFVAPGEALRAAYNGTGRRQEQ